MSTEKPPEAGLALFGGASHIRRWGVVCYGPADGVCSVDEQGCGYCRSECQSPKRDMPSRPVSVEGSAWDQTYLDAGYVWCRAEREWHRPPECEINEGGEPDPWWDRIPEDR